jgi:hypothetical protein
LEEGKELKKPEEKPKKVLELYEDGKPTGIFVEKAETKSATERGVKSQVNTFVQLSAPAYMLRAVL